MPLFQYFGWVGSLLLTALLAANWCCSVPIARVARSDVRLDQKINIRIYTDHKWPERVVFDTTRSTLTDEAKANAETDIGGSETPRSGGPPTLRRVRRDGGYPCHAVFSTALLRRPGYGAERVADWERRAISKSLAPVGNSARERYFPQSASQAARKKLTRSRTNAGNSLRKSFAPSPIRARISIGSRMRSMKICAVVRLRFGPKGPFEPRESVRVASVRTWETAAAA